MGERGGRQKLFGLGMSRDSRELVGNSRSKIGGGTRREDGGEDRERGAMAERGGMGGE